ncbi:hypothetical protein GALMADRAFT_77644 [Galerina marginata CBS 339.88]|uniref:BTB domain-containing protein n=1 Tax=Galerina marginata (strain CBS 339.88) TaxID=685588 RepID=A0A067SQW8_GALM3|nr:hypothetical protein GALMADRAFT_77644 [Galerina marginata CBS 339.88]
MSNSPSPSSVCGTKRKRTDTIPDTIPDTGSPTDTVITRSDMWFDDGNIVLQAGMTQFRVHRGIIARHSSVFKDMFAMAQPTGELEIEGCAVVHVMDTPQDWRNVLVVLYDSLKAYKSTDDISFAVLRSMLRLGTKYEFDHLRELVMEHLASKLPRSLDSWDKTYDEDGNRVASVDCHHFDLVNLLLEWDIRSVLPTALYTCIEVHTLKEILQGSTREDGTPVRLVTKAQTTMVLGKESLSLSSMQYFYDCFDPSDSEGCQTPWACQSVRAEVMKTAINNWHVVQALSPSMGQRMRALPTVFCKVCITKILERIRVGREEMWDKLPAYFGLSKWADLTDY